MAGALVPDGPDADFEEVAALLLGDGPEGGPGAADFDIAAAMLEDDPDLAPQRQPLGFHRGGGHMAYLRKCKEL